LKVTAVILPSLNPIAFCPPAIAPGTPKNDLGINRFMAAFASDHHMVIIDPMSLIDVIPFTNSPTQVALISTFTNRVLASSAPSMNTPG
jgi:sensor c-di-GMP phosphodiesterase-like protein